MRRVPVDPDDHTPAAAAVGRALPAALLDELRAHLAASADDGPERVAHARRHVALLRLDDHELLHGIATSLLADSLLADTRSQ
jgi:hypothetical protein